MGIVLGRLAAAGLGLPGAPVALGAYVPAVASGGLVCTAGQLPLRDGALISSGLVGESVSVEVARECARQAALNALAAASTVCDLDDITAVLRLVCYVASAPDFTDQPGIANAASDVIASAFAEAGVHAREAVGVARLPLDAPIELSITCSLR